MERSHRDDVQLAPAVEEPATKTQKPTTERFAEGTPPAVADAATGTAGRTASQLAFEEDGNVRELKAKVGALVTQKYGGDWTRAFDHYASGEVKDGKVNRDELKALLADAGVGNGMTRGAWASGILDKLDSDGDGKIGWEEFQKVTTASA